MPTDYTIPLEIAHGDVREIQFDDEVTAGLILGKLVGREKNPKDIGTYALLELVYDAANKLRELRTLEMEQPMYQLVPTVMAPKGSMERSELAVVNNANETVVFFNPYFRMFTGYPHEHLSFFPEEMMNVGEFEVMLKMKLGLHPKDIRFGLYGNYETHVARLEGSVMVASLKRSLDDPTCPRFFQFQVIPEHADHEILGVDRMSWLYFKSHKGFHRERKVWAALKGTTLFLYKSDNKKDGKISSVDRIDECRILNLGFNIPHTRYYVQLVHPSGAAYTLSSAYALRMRKWLKCLTRCHRVMDSQMPVTAKSIAGVAEPVTQKYSRRPSFVKETSMDEAREQTEQQRKMLEKPEDILKLIRADARALTDKPDSTMGKQWLETLRLFLNTITELKRPGFAKRALPTLKEAILKVCQFGSSLEESGLKMASFRLVEDIMDQCERIYVIYKSHVMDDAEFPHDIHEDELKYGPRMQEMRNILSNSDYYLQDHFASPNPSSGFNGAEEKNAGKEEEFTASGYIRNIQQDGDIIQQEQQEGDDDEYAADDEDEEYEEEEEPEEMKMPEDIPQRKRKNSVMTRMTDMLRRTSIRETSQ